MMEREKRLNDESQREAEERRNREERERMKKDSLERERREREERERKRAEEEREKREKKEAEERERREKREREERERRERERLEQERRAAEERRRFEDDVTIQAERRKKDEILAKLREIDEGGAGKSTEKKPDLFFVTQTKEDSMDSSSSKKSYTFSKPTENLHKGKPARTDGNKNSVFTVGAGQGSGQGRKNRDDINGLETGGYNPTFGAKRGTGATSNTATKTFSLFDDDDSKSKSTAPPAKQAQKSKLLDDLFGPSEKEGPKHNDLFSSSKPTSKAPARESRSKFPWEEDGPTKTQGAFNNKRENSATLFGGGSALVNDEDLHKSQIRGNQTLPRRPKQTTTTFSSRPTVNAVDHFDDEIEEVML